MTPRYLTADQRSKVAAAFLREPGALAATLALIEKPRTYAELREVSGGNPDSFVPRLQECGLAYPNGDLVLITELGRQVVERLERRL